MFTNNWIQEEKLKQDQLFVRVKNQKKIESYSLTKKE